jgi:hypothetical protein
VDVQIRLAAYTATFFLSLTFADGRSIRIEVILCKSITDSTQPSSSISSTVTGKKFNGSTITVAILVRAIYRATLINCGNRKVGAQRQSAIFA